MKRDFFTFFTLLLLITCLSSQLEARIIFGQSKISDLLAAYNFNREDYGHIIDQGLLGINGVLNENAKLIKGKYGNSLLLEAANDRFVALKTALPSKDYYIDLYANHTICAWVKVPKQDTDFKITLQFLQPTPNIPISELETVAGTQIAVKPNGNLGAVSLSIAEEHTYPYPIILPDPPEPAADDDPPEPAADDDPPIIAPQKSFFSAGYYLETKDQSINDGSWHHLALVYDGKRLILFVDGENVYECEYYAGLLWYVFEYIPLISVGEGATGAVDDLCIFYRALDEAYIQVLYELGFDKIMTVADVVAKDKITTTWGDIKSRQ